jgi:uroporphyrinogen-III synthase
MATSTIYLLSTTALLPELVEEAAQKGLMLEAEAYISIEPVADEALGARIMELGRQPLVAIFTSTNALEAIGDTGGVDWKIFCTSGATRQLVADRFGADAIAGTGDSAAELAAQIIRVAPDVAAAGVRGAAAYFFCGDQRRDELPDLLKEAGLTVHEVVVYRTLLTPRKTKRNYAGIAFFSPSAVESFFSVNEIAADIPLFAIGPTTAAAIRARCINPVITGGEPDKAALIRKMTDHFINKR